MDDLEAIQNEIHRIEEEAGEGVREPLMSINKAVTEMESADHEPKADRLREVRAEVDRLADDADGEVARRLDRLREKLRAYERDRT